MNFFKNNLLFLNSIPCQFFYVRLYASKNYDSILRRDTHVHELVSENRRPKQNFLASFGVAGTGALAIKKLINNERKKGNLVVARKPYPVYFFNDYDGVKTSIRNVACGYGFTLFSGRSKLNWKVYGCGINNDSQLGVHDIPLNNEGYQIIMEPKIINLPCPVDKISHISCGRSHSIVVADVKSADVDTQIIFSFGNNMFGQCGREIIESEIFFNNNVIHKVNLSKRIKQVECGEFTTYFLCDDGTLYGCGSNLNGQLANGDYDRTSNLVRFGGKLEAEVIKQISCRSNTVLALTEKGEVWAWGDNEHGLVFSNNRDSSVIEPCLLTMPDTVGTVVRLSAGNTVCAVINDNGQLFSWGVHLLGLGPNTQFALTPTMIPPGLFGGGLHALNDKGCRVVDVQCGVQQCFAITSSGCLYFWGEQGVVRGRSQTFPIKLPLTFNAKRSFVGADHCIVMGSPDL